MHRWLFIFSAQPVDNLIGPVIKLDDARYPIIRIIITGDRSFSIVVYDDLGVPQIGEPKFFNSLKNEAANA